MPICRALALALALAGCELGDPCLESTPDAGDTASECPECHDDPSDEPRCGGEGQ